MLLDSTIIALRQIGTLLTLLQAKSAPVRDELFIQQRVGAHVRHVHDHFRSLFIGLNTGVVDYNLRNRHSREESDFWVCCAQYQEVLAKLIGIDGKEKAVEIVSEINCAAVENFRMTSTVNRELLYLLNHTIHHSAIIKLIVETHGVVCPKELGLAPGTASYLRQTVSLNECAS